MSNNKINRISGSIGLENALGDDHEKNRYDSVGKSVLKHKEVLANILKYSVLEYSHFTCEEIMSFIDADSILADTSIAPDTDTRISGDDPTQSAVKEANMTFDVLFKVLNPDKNATKRIKGQKKNIHLHVDVELQGKYNPGYPIEKRGIYNLARMTSSQLEVINAKTNYNILEKSYCIFICVGNVPRYLWNTVSYYEFTNTKNIGKVKLNPSNYDLMGLVLIRIGEWITEDVTDIIHFLHGIFYNTNEVDSYIDFSKNEQFRKELGNMAITGEHLIEYGEHRQMKKTDAEKQRADAEKQRADTEQQRADKEKCRADKAESRIIELENQLNKFEERLNQLEKDK